MFLFHGEIQHLRKTPHIGAIKDTVIVGSFGTIVIYHSDFTNLFRLLQELSEATGIFYIQTHFEELIISTVFLRVDVGDVKVKRIDQFQNIRRTSGYILQTEFKQHNTGITGIVLQIADLFQLCICLADLFLSPFHIQKQHMRVYRFIIADTGDVDTKGCKAFTCFQKSANMIWHGGCICLFHNDHLRLLCNIRRALRCYK